MFYPARATLLTETVDELLSGGHAEPRAPKALVVPHAGYMYSGPIAATGYTCLAGARDTIRTVVLLGPAHRVPLTGLAAPSVDAFRTPLGDVMIDTAARATALDQPGVTIDDTPHAPEHSLEVHLPFLQRTLTDFRVLPLVVGRADADLVANVLDALWGGPETLIVVSTDLSHYERHDAATEHDERTVSAVLEGRIDAIGSYDACGAAPLRGLMVAAARHGLHPQLLDRRTSGETAGDRTRVVGYAALVYS
jgi:AmmeMemoRadiSam system protein B